MNKNTEIVKPESEADEVFAAGVDIGRLETATFFATVAITSVIQIYKKVKETKSWRLLKNKKNGDGRHFESLEEFCEDKLGKSYRRMRELASNHDSIGQEAFEQAEQLGLRQSDYNLIKALPAPKQVLVKQALAEGVSKEDLQRSLRELMAADQAEINALNNEAKHHGEEINRLNSDLNTAQNKLQAAAKTLPPPLLSRDVDAQMQKMLNAEAMGAAALDLINRQISEMAGGGDYLEERVMTAHSCLLALASRISLAFEALADCADDCELNLPPRPQMVVSEGMARDYLAAHTGYIELAIELAQKAQNTRVDVLGRGRGRPAGSKNKGAAA